MGLFRPHKDETKDRCDFVPTSKMLVIKQPVHTAFSHTTTMTEDQGLLLRGCLEQSRAYGKVIPFLLFSI